MTSSASPVRRAVVVAALVTVPLGLATGQAVAGSTPSPRPAASPAPAFGPMGTVLLNGTTASDPATPVQRRVSAAERVRAGAGPVSAPLPLQSPSTTCAVSGILWDDSSQDALKTAGEKGTPGAQVALRWNGTTTVQSTTTAANGTFVFDGLECSSYDVVFTLPAGYRWTKPASTSAPEDSKVQAGDDTGPGVTPLFSVGPDQQGTRATTATDGVHAQYIATNVDGGLVAVGAAVVPVPAATPAPAAPAVPAPAGPAPAPAADPATGQLAYTGTVAENVGWTGAALLAAGIVMVVGTSRRPRRVVVTA